MHRFDFTDNPLSDLHKTAINILPGIEKVVAIYFDPDTNSLRGVASEKNKGGHKVKELEVNSIYDRLLPFMKDKTPYTWYNKNSIPFEVNDKDSTPSIDIFTELENVVLLIRLQGEQKGLHDLVFLYFNENPSNFGVSNSDNPLSTESKSIIAFLLYNSLKSIVESKRNNKKALRFHNERTRLILDQTEKLSTELQRTHDNYGLSLVKLCKQYLKEHERKNKRSYVLAQDAIEKISNYSGELKDLEQIIEETVDYVNTLYFDIPGEIKISEWHINFNIENASGISHHEEMPSADKYTKTISLLDRLEQSALRVKKHNLKLTGSNVGNHFDKPVSAPAISDALYNHKGKIITLLNRFPDKWETIRAEFRPLKNIIEKNSAG